MLIVAFLVAGAIYFSTGNALAAYTLPYIAGALPYARSAFWIRSSDPNPARGKAMFWFYLAAAGWEAASFGLIFLTAVIFLVHFGVQFNNLQPPVAELVAVPIGLAIACVLGWLGISAARRGSTQMFVIPYLSRRCREDIANIPNVANSRRWHNRAMFVLVCSVFVPVLVLGAGIAILAASGQGAQNIAPIETFGLVILTIGPLLTIPAYAYLSRSIIAVTPRHC
jgi:hypothetical protein